MPIIVSQSVSPLLKISVNGQVDAFKRLALETAQLRMAVNQVPETRLNLSCPRRPGDGQARARLLEDAALLAQGAEIGLAVEGGSELFKGLLVEHSVTFDLNFWRVNVRVRHRLQAMRSTLHTALYADKSDSDVLRQIFSDHGIKIEQASGLDLQHEQLLQYQCSDWQFLLARLNANGVWLVPTMEGVKLWPPALTAAPEAVTPEETTRKQEISVEESQWSVNTGCQPAQVVTRGWDVDMQDSNEKTAVKPSAIYRGDFYTTAPALADPAFVVAYGAPLPAQELERLGQAQFDAQTLHNVRGSITVKGNTSFELGKTMEIKDLGAPYDGAALITAISHQFTLDSWRTVVEVGSDDFGEIGDDPVPGIDGLHAGVVEAFEQDKQGQFRLRVMVAGLGIDKPLWARFAGPYASKDSGLCLYPEVGDEVVVGFMGSDPRYPVILGAMHNPRNPPPFAPSADNSVKALVVKGKSASYEMGFDVTKSTYTLGVDKDTLQIGKDGIAVTSPKKIAITGKKIELKN